MAAGCFSVTYVPTASGVVLCQLCFQPRETVDADRFVRQTKYHLEIHNLKEADDPLLIMRAADVRVAAHDLDNVSEDNVHEGVYAKLHAPC